MIKTIQSQQAPYDASEIEIALETAFLNPVVVNIKFEHDDFDFYTDFLANSVSG